MAAKIFIDLGACLGDSVKRFYREVKFPSKYAIYCFEADPLLIPKLQQALFGYENVSIIAQAAGVVSGKKKLYRGKLGSSTMLLGKHTGRVNYSEPITVEAVDFAVWLREHVRPDDFVIVKMNIEGAEYRILEHLVETGALLLVDILFVHYHAGRMDDILKYKAREQALRKAMAAFPVRRYEKSRGQYSYGVIDDMGNDAICSKGT